MEVFLFHVKLKMKLYTEVKEILEQVYNGKNLNVIMPLYKGVENEARLKYLVYGVLRYSYSLDFFVKKLVSRPNDKVKLVLFIGMFELWFSNKPEHAIINDLVEFTKTIHTHPNVANFVNAILRSFQRDKLELIQELDKSYSTKYNVPDWLISELKITNKQTYLQMLVGLSSHPAFGLRINRRKIKDDSYLDRLSAAGIDYKVLENKLVLTEACAVDKLPGFYDGDVSVQDIGAQFLIDTLFRNNVNPETVLDACSAPGGKACQILENYDCELTAIDIDRSRLIKVQENLDRLNLKAKLIVGDASNQQWNKDNKKFDLVIADVPCSATGTIKRNPDIKITRTKQDISNFVTQQRQIVSNLWKNVNSGGYLAYITCSILNDENQENVKWIESNFANAKVVDEFQILPTQYNDGLFYALIKNNG